MFELMTLGAVGVTALIIAGVLIGLGLIKAAEWLADDWYADTDQACDLTRDWTVLHSDDMTTFVPVESEVRS